MSAAAGADLRIIAALAANRVIGDRGQLPWRAPEDLRHFARATKNGHLVVGRKTYESIGRELPGRTMYVVSRDPGFQAGARPVVCSSLDRAIDIAANATAGPVWIAGGAQIYEQALPLVRRMLLTHFDDEFEGDAFFPGFDIDQWKCDTISRSATSPSFTIKEYQRL
ncbi:MAG: dihydrofolate reductase [Betaproteobacteria bacterium AqS2]|uniref:Dihydrofolate reductase n=1 Tax=Candidatus Amphirhobacter heronislandensis TaxID=1732024 RepID=A0A930UGA1_9GAMM|nr:dihydrofolate reductase [Betaproteobacteria bacterium AqS2]